ncbi:hypothetical protein [Bradyrhizobium sp. th.b2]|uniref:hypothetical protein n=1 Tax=Bradyrhizobium sp. th-b2 TaxID=172088 RepID=UPI000403C551|nr:hypothetical protein [Bradyrhizobium sp. th.b2]
MAKRYIERPTARQIMTEAERRVIREQRQIDYDAKRENASDWLAGNYAPAPKAAQPMHTRLSKADLQSAADWAQFKRFEAMDDDNVTPDPLGKTGHYEPKSIHDPAPPSRIRREAPKKRKGRDPYAVSDDCDLPDYGIRKRSYSVVDDTGRQVGVVTTNPFRKTMAIAAYGLSSNPRK